MAVYEDRIIEAVFSNYLLIYEVDLEEDYIRVIYETPEQGTFGMLRETVYSDFIRKYIHERCDTEYIKICEKGASIKNLQKELAKKDVLAINYTVNYGKWRSVEYRISEKKEDVPTKALLCFRRMDDDRAETFRLHKEQEKNKALLEYALQESKQANIAKNAFLANLSHDIRKPLTSIDGYASLAVSSLDHRDTAKNYIDKIRQANQQMQHLISNVLDITRIESGRLELAESSVNLLSIVDELRTIVTPLAEEKQQELSLITDIQDHVIICDRSKVVQILTNLLTNAITYTPEHGSVSLLIKQDVPAPDGYGSYEFIVEDNGIGISKSFQRRMYEPFERERSIHEETVSGTGLGLTIVKQLVTMMGGALGCTSQKDKGSRFVVEVEFKLAFQDVFSFPSSAEPSILKKPEKPARRKDAVSPVMQPIFAGKRFLVVEDVETNQMILDEILGQLGAVTENANDGKEAYDMVKSSADFYYNAILMDIHMPVMDGYKSTQKIRKLENSMLASIPIIGISANAYNEDRRKAQDVGMDAYLAKPINTNELIRILKEAML
ncbi:MAG: response regulator [Lachnospiraceae bacterium]|nr:response regulator [Lachnospiraceae bacterium]